MTTINVVSCFLLIYFDIPYAGEPKSGKMPKNSNRLTHIFTTKNSYLNGCRSAVPQQLSWAL